MNRRVLVGGGAAAAVMAVIGNVKGKAQGVPDKVFLDAPITYTETFMDDGRIESIGQEWGNRWQHMFFSATPAPEWGNSLLYEIDYGVVEPLERLNSTWMPFGSPEHETVSEYNERVRKFFDWSFAEAEYREEINFERENYRLYALHPDIVSVVKDHEGNITQLHIMHNDLKFRAERILLDHGHEYWFSVFNYDMPEDMQSWYKRVPLRRGHYYNVKFELDAFIREYYDNLENLSV